MDIWNVGLVVMSVVVLANLALTLALARRVAGLQAQATGAGAGGLRPGDEVPVIQGVARDGTVRQSEAFRADRALVGFFSPGCDSCKADLPRLVQLSDDLAEEGTAVLAVVDGTLDESQAFVEQVPDRVEVLFVTRHDGPLLEEFAVGAYPTYAVLHGRTAAGSFATLDEAEHALFGP